MKLKNILNNVGVKNVFNRKNISIKSITHISKDIVKDGMFICLRGDNFDGNNYIEEAILKGAVCVVSDDDGIVKMSRVFVHVVFVMVEDIRSSMSLIAKNYYNRCVDNLEVVGIIGTSGKTTTSIMISQLLSVIDNNIGVIGTNGIFIGNRRLDNKFTTPDPLELHYIFYQMKMLGVKRVIMEVSAQAIYYKKLDGIKFKFCVFTNITPEHLDFFGSIENYARCKMNFFNKKNMNECVVNIDDFYGMELAYKLDIPCVSIGLDNPANSFAIDVKSGISGSIFKANILDEVFKIDSPFVGKFNVYNLISAMTVAKLWGLTKKQMELGLKCLKEIPGRFNVFYKGDNLIVVDFAHTPDSIDKILHFISENSNNKIITIIGCVGYSDINKRIDIASVCDKYSDIVIITTDNRGDVKFDDIASDMIRGISDKKYFLIEDRFEAIKFGVGKLKDDYMLVILGKGAENFQKIGNERISYSDIVSVKSILKEGV